MKKTIRTKQQLESDIARIDSSLRYWRSGKEAADLAKTNIELLEKYRSEKLADLKKLNPAYVAAL